MAKKVYFTDQGYEDDLECDRCLKVGARQYEGGSVLCPQCTHDDVFEVLNDRTD